MRTKLLPAVVCLCLGVLVLPGCEILGKSSHAVGDCVRTRVALGGTDITSADCPTASSALTPSSMTDPVYRVTEVLDLNGHCSASTGFGGIELRHEPDDVVYCLALATG